MADTPDRFPRPGETVDGIRPHLPLTPGQDRVVRRLSERDLANLRQRLAAMTAIRNRRLLAIGGPAHGLWGRWGRHADPDGYVRIPVPAAAFLGYTSLADLNGDQPPRYRITQVLLPGWLVPVPAAVHAPWPAGTARVELDGGAVLPGSRVGRREPHCRIGRYLYCCRLPRPVREWRRGDWFPGNPNLT